MERIRTNDLGAEGAAALAAATSVVMSGPEPAAAVLALGGFAMCVVDARAAALPVLAANDAFLAATGYRLDEIVDRSCTVLRGPQTRPRDLAILRGGVARDGASQAAIVIRRKDGAAVGAEVFVSPVRDQTGAIIRYVAIFVPAAPTASDPARDAVAVLRHQFRNQIQTMTSLASLLGQRLPAGDGRDAFQDMRARFESIAVLGGEDSLTARPERILALLADRLGQLYDPARRRSLTVSATPFEAGPRRLATLAQILTELMIDLFRSAPDDGACTVAIGPADGGGARLRVSAATGQPREPTPVSALGLLILESLARGLGGGLSRSVDGGLESEVVAPAETTGAPGAERDGR